MFRRKSWLTRIVDALIRERRMRDLLRGYNKRRMNQAAFTLVELLIVVTIIGILAAIAIPAYRSYQIEAKLSEGLSDAQGVQTALTTLIANDGGPGAALDADVTALNNTPVHSAYVSSIVAAMSHPAGGSPPLQLTVQYNDATTGLTSGQDQIVITPLQWSTTAGGFQPLFTDTSQQDQPIAWACGGTTANFATSGASAAYPGMAAGPLSIGSGVLPVSDLPKQCQ